MQARRPMARVEFMDGLLVLVSAAARWTRVVPLLAGAGLGTTRDRPQNSSQNLGGGLSVAGRGSECVLRSGVAVGDIWLPEWSGRFTRNCAPGLGWGGAMALMTRSA